MLVGPERPMPGPAQAGVSFGQPEARRATAAFAPAVCRSAAVQAEGAARWCGRVASLDPRRAGRINGGSGTSEQVAAGRGGGAEDGRFRVGRGFATAAQRKNAAVPIGIAVSQFLRLRLCCSGVARVRPPPAVPGWAALCTLQQVLQRQADVLCDLAQQNRRDISSGMHGNGCASAIRVPKLLVRAPLANLSKAQCFQDRDDLARSENPRPVHA